MKWIWSKYGDLASEADKLRFVDARIVVVTKMMETAFLIHRGRRDLSGLVLLKATAFEGGM